MGLVILFVVLALLGWLSVRAVRSLWARGVGPLWWAALVGCIVVGFALGVWFGFFFEYQPEAKIRVIGWPVPIVCFVLEKSADGEERWIDYVSPEPLLFGGSSVLLFSFVSIYPVWLANTLCRLVRGRGERPTPTNHHE